MAEAAAQADALLHVASIDQQADAVAGVERDLGERERGVHRQVELAEFAYARAQEPARVHHDPDRLAPLHLEQLGDVLAPARGRGPADIAELVAGLVFAQAFKFAAHAALADQAL